MRLHIPTIIALAISTSLLLLTGCDSSVAPESETNPTTIQFERSSASSSRAVETVDISVLINNPEESEVSVELLYAAALSETDVSEFDLPASAAVGEDGNGFVVDTVTFPPTSVDGDKQSFTLPLASDSEVEGQLDAVFTLQNIQGASRGARDRFVLALGSISLLDEDFSDDELAPFSVFSVSSNEMWAINSFSGDDQSPYVRANGFGADEASNDWLISPALDFASTADQTLSFKNAKNFDDGGVERGLLLKISTDYDGEGNPEDFTWTDISDRVETYSDGGYTWVESGTIDISDAEFQSESTYIAFQYKSSGTGGGTTELWQVDDIVVRAQ